MRLLFAFYVLFGLATASVAQLPQVVGGSLHPYASFPSKGVTARNIDVWLPASYSPAKKYAVLYMHDGQMLFDSALTWNKQAWNVDDVLTNLLNQNAIIPTIVVGIWNAGTERHSDYFPQKIVAALTPTQKDSLDAQLQRAGRTKGSFTSHADHYLAFITTELKPYIDSTYAVYTDAAHTFIAGSSMGGLISMYAVCEYPNVFGGAACLSTHWLGSFTNQHNAIPQACVQYLKTHLPDPNSHRFYFDCGDQTLDAFYPPIQQQVDAVMRENGYQPNNWTTRYFPGANHSEQAWHNRLEIPLLFLLHP
jgi:enterochelin esterase-like enzyme